jgi:hypothetical protein
MPVQTCIPPLSRTSIGPVIAILYTVCFCMRGSLRSCAHVNECRPTLRRRTVLSELRNGVVQSIGDGVHCDDFLRKKSLVEVFGDIRTVRIVHRPGVYELRLRFCAPGLSITYHIVANTLRKPANSIAAARCIVWSGCSWSPLAVSHALRKAKKACFKSSSMSLEIVRRPSLR